MNKCIYTNKDDSNATFKSAEHVFPKCIGGQYCLPRGFVSDQINNEFSKIELTFARENPIIVLNRMFYKKQEEQNIKIEIKYLYSRILQHPNYL